MDDKAKYQKLIAKSFVNKALDYDFLDGIVRGLVRKHYPKMVHIERIRHQEHKRRVGKKHSSFIYSFYITGLTADNNKIRRHLVYSAHTDNSRKIAYDNLHLIDKAGFNDGPYQAIKTLDFINDLHALVYRAVDGKNLYQHIQSNLEPRQVTKILELTSNWIKNFHSLKITAKLPLFDYHDINPHSSVLVTAVTESDSKQGEKLSALLVAMDKLSQELNFSRFNDLVYGDLHPENIITRDTSQKNLTMIDFTDLALGDQLRDIGTFIQQLHFMARDYYPTDEVIKFRRHFVEHYCENSIKALPIEKLQRINFYQAWNSLRGFTWLFYTSKARPASFGILEDAWLYLNLAIEKKSDITISH